MPTVAEMTVEALVQRGVKRIYGGVGDSLNSIVDAVRRREGITWVQVRHEEEVGAFVASTTGHGIRVFQSSATYPLAQMVGTTRSRINYFMNKFRKQGFIDYNGKRRLTLHRDLLLEVLQD